MIQLSGVALADVDVCCDLERRVFNAQHTHEQVAAALGDTDWQELHQWTTQDEAS
jgi:hypothetical protein